MAIESSKGIADIVDGPDISVIFGPAEVIQLADPQLCLLEKKSAPFSQPDAEFVVGERCIQWQSALLQTRHDVFQ